MRESVKLLYRNAVKLKSLGRLQNAKTLLIKASKLDGEPPAIFAVLADTCWEMTCLDEAVQFFLKVIKLAPKKRSHFYGSFPLPLGAWVSN
jgi:tetratricopeptide (TPR) repeat protein